MYEGNVVSYAVAKNCMMLIANGAASSAFESIGITQDDFELTTMDDPFVAADRPRVSKVINSLTHGVLDVVGLPRIEVPAEFRASVIATFVKPGNLAVVCRWMETGFTADSITEGGQLEPCSANQLFALCCKLSGDAPRARQTWEKRTRKAVEEVVEPAKEEKLV